MSDALPTDYRAKMSPAEFDAIKIDEEYPIDYFYEALIGANNKFHDIYEEFPYGYEDPKLFAFLTVGQRLLIVLGAFDGQIKNGGITQFFWNFPHYIFDAADGIELLGETVLLSNYEKAVEALLGKKNKWHKLREECYQIKNSPRWESFQRSYDLLDLGWFDDAYFDKRGYNEKKEWVRQEFGLGHSLMKRLANYIRLHRSEFIQE